MSDKKKLILVFSLVFVLLGGYLIFQEVKVLLYKNPEGTVGNTGGNINNGGLFCQVGDKVYFANQYDDGTLYVMNVDETDIKKLSNAKPMYMNADGTYLYYFVNDVAAPSGLGGFSVQMLGIYRSDLKGKKAKCLDRALCTSMKLIDNTLYYARYDKVTKTTLYQVDIRRGKGEQALDFEMNPASSYGNKIYYNGVDGDHYLYSYDTLTGQTQMVYDGNVWSPDAQGDYIYFMNISDDYKLCRYDMATGEVQTLTQDRVDCYLVCGNYIFYQKNSETEPAIKVMYTDGSDPRMIAEGNYTSINATSKFVYFMGFGENAPMYKVSLESGDFQVMTFDAARDAAVENAK